MKVAIIGAGWAGMAAAIAHTQAGRQVTVFEAARTVGGRARAVQATLPNGHPITLDNGQHILIGAYTESLRLMRLVGVDPDTALLRLPLTLQYPDGQGLALSNAPPPLDALWGIATARGWAWSDKLALLRTAAMWRLRDFACAPQMTVAQLCAGLSAKLTAEFIEPLCVSALNTPAQDASGQVFLRVLRDSLFSGRGGSNLLLPRTDLGALFPQAAARWLERAGGRVRTGQRVHALVPLPHAGWQVDCHAVGGNGATDLGSQTADSTAFDHITLACPPWEASRLVAALAQWAHVNGAQQQTAQQWSAQAAALQFEAIATVYAHAPGVCMPQPMLALRNTAQYPAQFVFDRGPLDGQHGLLAFVVSTSNGNRAQIQSQVLKQAAVQLGLPGLQPVQTVVEKRATFACTPGLQRPGMQVLSGLTACGDYVDGPYPATLEGAVLSGTAVAALA
ncbi:MAG: hydroxysqualene dehydroxylase HpnE [Burkholderiaceae bacterium]|nr:hydroxysqualene dehydroxylase HpnE [Burkholderiaceae bacterium]